MTSLPTAAVDRVVAGLAVDLVVAADVDLHVVPGRRCGRRTIGSGVEQVPVAWLPASLQTGFSGLPGPKNEVGPEVRAARRVVEQRDAADDDLAVDVVGGAVESSVVVEA